MRATKSAHSLENKLYDETGMLYRWALGRGTTFKVRFYLGFLPVVKQHLRHVDLTSVGNSGAPAYEELQHPGV